MNKEEKGKELIDLIERIKEQSDKLDDIEHLSAEDLHFMLSKATELRDGLLVLDYLKKNQEEKIEITKNQDEVLEDENAEDQVEMEEQQNEVVEEIVIQDDVVLEEEMDKLEIEEQTKVGKEEYEEKVVESEEELINLEEIESNQEISSKPDVNETFSESGDSSVGDQLQNQPIGDLLSAIAINERYLYANELFDGDIEDFRSVMGILNEFQNRDEALEFFEKELRTKYSWKEDNDLANALSQLVERRFHS